MKVSTCIITYNQESYIKECLDGAINQQLNCDYEIIIGDDCSNDNTSVICENYAKKYPDIIKYFKRKENLGMMGNWIETIKNCSGKYIALCEGDDYWTDPYKLQKQVDFLEENEEYILCGTYATTRFNDKEIQPNEMVFKSFDFYDAVWGNPAPTLTLCFRNEPTLIREMSGINYPIGDIALNLHLLKSGFRAAKLPFNSAVYRYHGMGANSGNNNFNNLKIQLEAKILFGKKFGNKHFKSILRKKIISLFLDEIKHLFQLRIRLFDFKVIFMLVVNFFRI